MTANDRNLLSSILDDFADRLGNDGCNDWEWPKTWSESYKKKFLKRYNTWAGDNAPGAGCYDDVTYDSKYGPNNVSLVYFLRHLFRSEVK